MYLTPEQQTIGRRNFLKALAGTPALAVLGAAAAIEGPIRGGPVRIGFVGVGAQGRVLLANTLPSHADVRAICDINPTSLAKSDEIIAKQGRPAARHYVEWRDMLQKEDLEAVITALPLWMHAEVAASCLEAGKHVLCEKMMAWDAAGCERMAASAESGGRVLEIGHQRRYNPIYRAAYDGIVRKGLLGDVYYARLVWHRNSDWRRKGEPPSRDFDASRWGYPTFDHLLNWRLYWKYSKGLFAELACHQVDIANWFFGAAPTGVTATGGLYRFNDGRREVYDHVYATFQYPHGRTATFSSIESSAFDDYYEAYFGTKATLILQREREAFLFEEGADRQPTGIEVSSKAQAALDASETQTPPAGGAARQAGGREASRPSYTQFEVSGFCAAIRTRTPLACGAEDAMVSARSCILANDAVSKQALLKV